MIVLGKYLQFRLLNRNFACAKLYILNMKRLFSIFAIALACCTVSVAQMAEPVHFSVSHKVTEKGQLLLSFSGKIDEGWHVYGSNFAEGGPTVASITLDKCEGLKPMGGLKTQGRVHRGMDAMFGMEVETVEGSVTFTQAYEITSQKYVAKGYLTYGACNDENCIPPSDVEFDIAGEAPQSAAASAVAEAPKDSETKEQLSETVPEASADSTETVIETAVDTKDIENDLWAPVVDILRDMDGTESSRSASLLWIFLMGMGGGLLALLTPCVWPIIPMTVSFFLKRNKDSRSQAVREALTYGASIVVIYVSLGWIVTMIFGASALNAMSTNAPFNIFFFLLLVLFGLSFLGGFELSLPSSWTNAVDSKAERTTGFISIFLMAFTLSLVSFSCTGPIIGFLLVEVGTSGQMLAPVMGMLGFALALALPFTLFALFPTMLKSAPKSGNWMNCIKVLLGFLELAFALKFLSVADLAYGWHILDREVFLALWIVIFALMGAYLLHWIRLPHDEDEYDEMGEVVHNPRTGIWRLVIGMGAFAFALYMVPGLWGAPCKAVSAFAPPMNTQDFTLAKEEVRAQFDDYEAGMSYAKDKGLPVMIDFTGFGCVNCRKMEAAVWTDPVVADIINNSYVLITLHVDDKTPLPEPLPVEEMGKQRTLRTVGDKWSYLQRHKFGANAQPFYVLVDTQGMPLAPSYGYDEDIPAFIEWLNKGIAK